MALAFEPSATLLAAPTWLSKPMATASLPNSVSGKVLETTALAL